MLPELPLFAIAALIGWGWYRASRVVSDSYFVLVAVLLVTGLLTGIWAFIDPDLPMRWALPTLVLPALVGVILGTWPDVLRSWPKKIADDAAVLVKTSPDILVALAGAALGLWAWAAIANALGLLGALLGASAFAGVTLGSVFVLEWLRDHFKRRKASSGNGEIGRGTS